MAEFYAKLNREVLKISKQNWMLNSKCIFTTVRMILKFKEGS